MDLTAITKFQVPLAPVMSSAVIPDSVLMSARWEEVRDEVARATVFRLETMMASGSERTVTANAMAVARYPRRFRDWLLSGWAQLHEGYHPRVAAWMWRHVKWETVVRRDSKTVTVPQRFCPHIGSVLPRDSRHYEWLRAEPVEG